MAIIETGKKVLQTEAKAILSAIEKIDSKFVSAVEILHESKGQIVITGMGKSGLVGRKIAATLTSTGTPSLFLHPAEAIHGDIGIINPQDTVIAISTSGETEEVVRLLSYIKRLDIKLIAMVGNPESTLAKESDVFIDCGVEKEACPIGLVPSASSTLTLAIGDALAIALMEKKGFSEEDFRYFHPGGAIGKRLLKVKHLMHKGSQIPVVKAEDLMKNVIRVINEKRFGVAVVVEGKNLVAGIITDGDLRRMFLRGVDFSEATAMSCMTSSPMWIDEECLAVEALKKLEAHSITSLVVKDDHNRLLGLLHLHDLWRTEMI